MQTKTKMKNEVLVKEKYKPPHVLTKDFNESLRKQKVDMEDIRAAYTEKVRYDMPTATDEKIEATVYRLMYEA